MKTVDFVTDNMIQRGPGKTVEAPIEWEVRVMYSEGMGWQPIEERTLIAKGTAENYDAARVAAALTCSMIAGPGGVYYLPDGRPATIVYPYQLRDKTYKRER